MQLLSSSEQLTRISQCLFRYDAMVNWIPLINNCFLKQDMLEERDAKIRELEETIKALQEKLGACDRSEKQIINDKDEDILETDKQENNQTLNASGQENGSDDEHEEYPTQ